MVLWTADRLSEFVFGMMGNMGAEIFDLVWVQGIVHFLSILPGRYM